MKKKFDFKLTFFLVSLFVGLLLLILGNKNKYCLSFGLIIMAISIGIYALYKAQNIDDTLKELNNEIEETDGEDTYSLQELYKAKSKLKKQKVSVNIVFFTMSILLLVLGISNML